MQARLVFTRFLGLSVLCLIGQNVIADQNVTQDISAEIEPADIEYAKQVIVECLDGGPVGENSEYGAFLWEGHQTLVIEYDWHENSTVRKARYTAEFGRESADGQWVLFEIGYTGEQTLAGQGESIYFNGYLDREAIEEVIAHIAVVWGTSTSAPFTVSSIVTNRTPPTGCTISSPKPEDLEIVYEVTVRNLSPQPRQAPRPPPNSLVVGGSGSTDDSYKVRIAQADSGDFLTTNVFCQSGSICDPELLERFRANLDRPTELDEIEMRMQDAVAVLPARLRGAHVRSTYSMLLGTAETFDVQFAETAVSQSRTETAHVMCSRRAGTRDQWNCRHTIDGIKQQVSGQTQPIDLSWTTFSESEAVRIANELRTQLAAHPNVRATASDIQIFSIRPNDEKLECWFRSGRAFGEAVFMYDGEVTLESVDLAQTIPADVELP